MHIALVRREISLRRSGAERMCVNLLRHLLAQQHRIAVFAEHLDAEFVNKVEYIAVPKRKWGGWSPTERFAAACAPLLAGRDFDIVHSLARVQGVDSFQSLDPVHAHWLSVGYRQPLVRWMQRQNPRHHSILKLEAALSHQESPRMIIVQSRFDAELWQRHYGVSANRLRVVPNGVDTSAFQPSARVHRDTLRAEWNVPRTTPLLMFAGNDFRRKGLDALLHALAKAERSDAQLWVLGQDNAKPFQRTAQRLGLARRVQFLGKQPDLARFYAAADLFVLPTWYDPFACVVLEALACGTPVVTTRCGGGADVVADGVTGYVFDSPADTAALAAILDQHFARPRTDRDAMAEACVARAQDFTAESYAQQTEAVLLDVHRAKRAA